MSIIRKLLTTTLLIASVSVAAIVLLAWRTTANQLRALEVNRVANSVESEARLLQATINMVTSDMTMLAEGCARYIVEGQASGLQVVSDQIDMMMRERPAYRQAKMLFTSTGVTRTLASARNGSVVSTTVDPPVGQGSNKALLAEMQGLTNFTVHSARWVVDDIGEKVLSITMPIRSKGHGVVGTIAVSLSIDQVIREHGLPHNDIVYWVADNTGEYLYQSRPEAAASHQQEPVNAIRDFQLAESWERMLSGTQPHIVVELPSAVTLSVSRVTLDTDDKTDHRNTLVVGGTRSLTDMGEKAAAVQKPLAIVVVGVGFLMVLALVIATRRLMRPIKDLTNVADLIAAGNPDAIAPVSGDDEIGILGRAMMRMADELRKAGKNSEQSAMGQMASMIAHDLRNALSSVKMNLQILESHHQKAGDREIDNCETALGQVLYMETILNDMLTFARPGTAEFDWVDLGDTLRTASTSLLPEMTSKFINLKMEEEHKWPTIMADRNKLLQLFQNLLINSIHAVPEWGHISITTRCLLHESQPSVEVKIEDDGPGISPEIVNRIFEPFFTTSARGTGLGLPIAQRIVRQHGGKIYVDPTGDHGTTMVVLLPLTQGEKNDKESLQDCGATKFKCSRGCLAADRAHCGLAKEHRVDLQR